MIPNFLKQLGTGVLAAGMLLGGAATAKGESVEEHQIAIAPVSEAAKMRYFSALDNLAYMCSQGDQELAILIDMKTGEWMSPSKSASAREVVTDLRYTRELGRDDDRTWIRACHCHPTPQTLDVSGFPSTAEPLTNVVNRYAARLPSPHDVGGFINEYGTYVMDRNVEGHLDACILPTYENQGLKQSQSIVLGQLSSSVAETARGIAQKISLPRREETGTARVAVGSFVSANASESTTSLSVYGGEKAEEYSDVFESAKPRNALSSSENTLINFTRSATRNILRIEEARIEEDGPLWREYRKSRKKGELPALQTAEGPMIYKPCDGTPPIFSNLDRDQVLWAHIEYSHDATVFADFDNDGLPDIVHLDISPPAALESCGLTEDWENKHMLWAVRFGNGKVAEGHYKGSLPQKLDTRTQGVLRIHGQDYSGNADWIDFEPVENIIN